MLDVLSEGKGEGSGIVIDRDGHILTNLHVVEDAREIQVTLFDGKTYEAKPVGHDPVTDTAVLKIDAPAESLFPVMFGNSTSLLVGQRVFAIGNPFGFERTLTTGIISSLNRSLARPAERPQDQVAHPDRRGDQPGQLRAGRCWTRHGRMIGMNTAIASRTGDSAGVGFAIPINTIARVVPQLIARRPRHPRRHRHPDRLPDARGPSDQDARARRARRTGRPERSASRRPPEAARARSSTSTRRSTARRPT